MNIQTILKEQREIVRPDKETLSKLKSITDLFLAELKKQLAKFRVRGDIFIGGSFAKGTIVRQEQYDVDILIRLSNDVENLTELVEKPIVEASKVLKMRFEKVHGSRDYFRVISGNIVLEIIPVSKIAKPLQEKNVTDLTYFHVPYVKRHGKGLEDEIRLAKQFCTAQEVYGAESYINGFSGYALECLVIYYGSFIKMLKALSKVKSGEKLIVDPAKHYKKNEALVRINESKLKSPIVLIDPTYRERNALAALSDESLVKFQKVAVEFLKRPDEKLFKRNENNYGELTKLASSKKAELVKILMTTDRQAGDIAGTKLKKFSGFLEEEMRKYFSVYRTKFNYEGSDEGEFYIVAKAKKEYVKNGPPIKMLKAAIAFKKANKKTIVSGGRLKAVIPIKFTLKDYLIEFSKESEKLKQMAITKIIIEN